MKPFVQFLAASVLVLVLSTLAVNAAIAGETEQWDIFEISFNGPRDGNPFEDVNLSAEFKLNDDVVKVTGFYEGNGVYYIRFMPDRTGEWNTLQKAIQKSLTAKRAFFPVAIHRQTITAR